MLSRAQFLEDVKRMVFHSLAAASQLVSALVEKPAEASILLVSSYTTHKSRMLGSTFRGLELRGFFSASKIVCIEMTRFNGPL